MPNSKTCLSCNRTFNSSEDYLTGTFRWRMDSSEALYFNCSCGSTLMLPKGKYHWYDPTHIMSEKAANLFHQIKTIFHFPRVPQIIVEFEQLLNLEEISSRQLAECAIKDPFFSARIIGLANMHCGENKYIIYNLEYAIASIGVNSLKNLISVLILWWVKPLTKYFTMEKLWLECCLTGKICDKIRQKFDTSHTLMSKDEAFLLGTLLNSTGKLVASYLYPDLVDKIYLRTNQPSSNITWQEAEVLENAHPCSILSEIGGAIYGFSPYILDHIRSFHDKTKSSGADDFLRVSIVSLSVAIAQIMLGSEAPSYSDEATALSKSLNFNSNFIYDIQVEMQDEYEQIKQNISEYFPA